MKASINALFICHLSFVICHVGGSLQYLTPRAELQSRLIRRGYV